VIDAWPEPWESQLPGIQISLLPFRKSSFSTSTSFNQAYHKLVALTMARFLGFITALAATGAFALTPE
jgi:hypothetical protein